MICLCSFSVSSVLINTEHPFSGQILTEAWIVEIWLVAGMNSNASLMNNMGCWMGVW